MELRGDIMADSVKIGGWGAQRIQPLLGDDDTYDYDCKVVVNGKMWAGVVSHRHSAGATSLAAKVLLAATVNGVADG